MFKYIFLFLESTKNFYKSKTKLLFVGLFLVFIYKIKPITYLNLLNCFTVEMSFNILVFFIVMIYIMLFVYYYFLCCFIKIKEEMNILELIY